MCKHCKPKEATPAAEVGNLTDQLALRSQTEAYIEGLEGMINRAEKLLATYEESRTRNQEPSYRYFWLGPCFWKVLPEGPGWYRYKKESTWHPAELELADLLRYGYTEIPNPDQEP
jgi:hypothetical protein